MIRVISNVSLTNPILSVRTFSPTVCFIVRKSRNIGLHREEGSNRFTSSGFFILPPNHQVVGFSFCLQVMSTTRTLQCRPERRNTPNWSP